MRITKVLLETLGLLWVDTDKAPLITMRASRLMEALTKLAAGLVPEQETRGCSLRLKWPSFSTQPPKSQESARGL